MAVADLTPAEELRAAAARLRAAPTGPATHSDNTILIGGKHIGGCPQCRVAPEIDAPLDELLVGLLNAREPLATLLDRLADDMEALNARAVVLPGSPRRVTVVLDKHRRLRHDWTAALATARAPLGGGEKPGATTEDGAR